MAALDQELSALQRAGSGDKQLVHVHWLHKEGVRAELHALDGVHHVARTGQHDHGHVAVDRAGLAEEFDPGHARRPEVGHDERRAPGLEGLQALAAIVGELAGVARRVEDLAQEVAHFWVFLNDQDVALRHVRLPSVCTQPRRPVVFITHYPASARLNETGWEEHPQPVVEQRLTIRPSLLLRSAGAMQGLRTAAPPLPTSPTC